MFAPAELFELNQTAHAVLFEDCSQAWEALPKINAHLAASLQPAVQGEVSSGATIGDQVFIGKGTVVEAGAMIVGPAIIGANCIVRHNAYIRQEVIVGDGCMVGNACELKNCLLFNDCQVPQTLVPSNGTVIRLAPGVPEVLLDPRRTWGNPEAYDAQAAKLVEMFAQNFEQYLPHIDEDVKAAALG